MENPRGSTPQYELYASNHGLDDMELEVWQAPSSATPNISRPVRIAGLRGRNLTLVEHRVLKRLHKTKINLADVPMKKKCRYSLDEDLALNLGLLFRVLAPMRNRDNMRNCAEGIETMPHEETAYWLGMAIHRKNPRRVLMALRILLTEAHNKKA
ncbi:MAG: hypothetical protein GY862_09920 [Gammaproteobacteria bacterium]|nr:hypothetical protein [Gammaproteobacteria bacterium]